MTKRTHTATPLQSNNEYAMMPPAKAVAIASEMLAQHAEDTDRALALAIVLRDRLEGQDDGNCDPTDIVLANMLVEQLAGAPENDVKLCLSALLEKCQPQQCGA